ncbi:MAG: hypothetical protein BWK80_44620 [Desulfobacteraceae bacterium IS3]|nr:MAG: hypothetical protein BWK80_44620 [Desulfobacteraceae bacterium IS3]
MLLFEIEQKIIKSLSRAEKIRLIADITKMLQVETETEPALLQHFKNGAVYPVFTPSGMEEAAARLQEFIEIAPAKTQYLAK